MVGVTRVLPLLQRAEQAVDLHRMRVGQQTASHWGLTKWVLSFLSFSNSATSVHLEHALTDTDDPNQASCYQPQWRKGCLVL